MCYGYHARLSKEDQEDLLEQRRKNLEEQLKKTEDELKQARKEPLPLGA